MLGDFEDDRNFFITFYLAAVLNAGNPFTALLYYPYDLFAETAGCRTANGLDIANVTVEVDDKLNHGSC